ncbi:flavodoxin [Pontibacillus chungwhensis BH030062]|uniref:Flavodoxin n=2 Tax=Pontibacillus TaxID=289201 RepID=A0A0A2UXB6_9BACI|nr:MULTISPECIES: NAD(P)H-dependent oxidoreductase [Pontibacillus]KGP91176.1 flavodoxin [Pontibacillus chungwhensis BH030062]GGD09257.1 NAD(P)H dehydrogenase (quinone) [Pontibacillus salipaludis]
MNNILVINGHEPYPIAEGRLNKTLFDEIVTKLSTKYDVKTTVVSEGYDVKEEQEKFKWADTIVVQTPMYWFSLPGGTKTYMDSVYEPGVFFGGGEKYGESGLMTGRKYMFSTTWNAPKDAFSNHDEFFKGQDLEEAIDHLHNMQKYVGMEPLKSFGAFDVIKNPDIDTYMTELRQHLAEVFDV